MLTALPNATIVAPIKKGSQMAEKDNVIELSKSPIIKNTSELQINAKKFRNLCIYLSTFGEILVLP